MVGLTELDIETLVSETERLLSLEISELYATLGAQLLLLGRPTSAAGTICYLSQVGRASSSAISDRGEYDGSLVIQWKAGVALIHKTLRARGEQYFAEARNELRDAICHEEILAWSDDVNRSIIRILITIVSGTLRTPRILDAVSAITVAILLKLGLRNFCA
jgi:hypothetical protein